MNKSEKNGSMRSDKERYHAKDSAPFIFSLMVFGRSKQKVRARKRIWCMATPSCPRARRYAGSHERWWRRNGRSFEVDRSPTIGQEKLDLRAKNTPLTFWAISS